MIDYNEDTIAAIATKLGVGAISIIRVSGKDAIPLVNKIFSGKDLEKVDTHTINYGYIKKENEKIDEVLVSVMKAPKTFTREDVVEINCHGGINSTLAVFSLLQEIGIRVAEKGEFTKRAFLNGRIDLTEAEAIMDLIESKSDNQRKLAMNSLEGKLKNYIHSFREPLKKLIANIEVNIDYPEYYDIEEVTKKDIEKEVEKLIPKLQKTIEESKSHQIVKSGIKTVIVGRPNVGKSSILNTLINQEKAIVTDIEGTTRDTIEEFVTVEGVPLKLIDTAGIREAKDEVEKIGIAKSKEIAKDADLIIAIFDSSRDLTDEDREILNIIKGKNAILVLNKTDLNKKIDENMPEIIDSCKYIVKISTLEQQGLEDLYKIIGNMFSMEEISVDNTAIITNLRHKNLISKALESCKQAMDALTNGMPLDIIAVFLKEILENLGEITGEIVTDDIISEIFSKFCLGK